MSKEETDPMDNKENSFVVEIQQSGVTTTTTPAPFEPVENKFGLVEPSAPKYVATTAPPDNIEQQRFLGSTIVKFSCSGGFGESPAQLNVTLVKDPKTSDTFNTPTVGTPAYFTFGDVQKDHTDGGFEKAISDLYRYSKSEHREFYETGDNKSRHFAFGGLVQSWNYNEDPSSGQLYTVTLTDPREILSNVSLLLNNHAGTTYSNNNLINVYGFLEHISEDQRANMMKVANLQNSYTVGNINFPHQNDPKLGESQNAYIQGRPVTGVGMSLRSEAGIPAFRVVQAMNSLMGNHEFPVTTGADNEYAQYGGFVKFRGKYYVVDVSDVPIPDPYYKLNFDTISILDLCMEFCEACNHEMLVSLLPLDETHMAFDGRGSKSDRDWYSNWSAADGLIKVSTIDRTKSGGSGARGYLDETPFWIENQDIGTEMQSAVTDRFITGAKEVNMHYFTSEHDYWPSHGGWKLEYSLKNQIIPYYGTLGTGMATIPRGAGPWSQIILDSSSVTAFGVGLYYVTTEMELRAADISFDQWLNFLNQYNSKYWEYVVDGDIRDGGADGNQEGDGEGGIAPDDGAIEVTVPRCCWPPHPTDLNKWAGDTDRFAPTKQICSPPYGWPLYWKRASGLGAFSGGAIGNPNTGLEKAGKGDTANNDQKNTGKDSETPPIREEAFDAQSGGANTAVDGAQAKRGLKNLQIVYNFLKAVADECLGKKFLVKIPQLHNNGWSASDPFGFPPRDDAGAVDLNLANGAWNRGTKETMLYPANFGGTPKVDNWRVKGALDVGYNAEKESFVFNYYPEPQGGVDPRGVTLAPPALSSFFASDNRTQTYVNFPQGDFDVEGLDKNSFLYANGSLHVSAELDSNYLIAPPLTKVNNVVAGNGAGPMEVIEAGKQFLIDPETGERKAIEKIKPYVIPPPQFEPQTPEEDEEGSLPTIYDIDNMNIDDLDNDVNITMGGVSGKFLTIDLVRAGANFAPDFYNDGYHVYVLVTVPRISIGDEEAQSKALNFNVNPALIQHYLRWDATIGMPGMTNVIADYPVNDELLGSNGLNPLSVSAIEKAVDGLTFSINNRIQVASPASIYPMNVAIPFMSTQRSYGPYYNSAVDSGQLEYIHDESLNPWTYGSYSNMDAVAASMLAGTAGADLDSERASFTMVGWPEGITLGGLLQEGPAITSINTDFSAHGIKTNVTLDSYTASFGKMARQRTEQIKKLSRNQQKFQDHVNAMIRKNIISGRDNFSKFKAGAEFHALEAARTSVSRYGSTPITRGERTPSNSINIDVRVESAMVNGVHTNVNFPTNEKDYSPYPFKQYASSIQSKKDTAEMGSLMLANKYSYFRQYWHSISTTIDEMFHPASTTWHNIFPVMGQPTDLILYNDVYDDDHEISYYD